jgi:predicted DNA-binding transcriptional regulator AlpA
MKLVTTQPTKRELLSEKELNAEYGLSLPFLRRARLMGHKPNFIKAGGKLVFYRRSDIEQWLLDNTVLGKAA